MSTALGAVNPLEATFCLLKALRDEIREVRDMLEEEKRARGTETAELAAQLQALRDAKIQRFEETENAIEEMKTDMQHRCQKLQVQTEKVVADKVARFEKIEAQVDVASIDHKGMVQAVNKRLAQEASQWRMRADVSDREIKDHKNQAEIHVNNHRRCHEDLREEVERIASLLRENSMARDPFRHFAAKPMLRPLSASPSPSAMSTATPFSTARSSIHTSSIGTAHSESPYQRVMNS